jgi:hypothetical protein
MSLELTFSPPSGYNQVRVNEPIILTCNKTLNAQSLQDAIHVYGPNATVLQGVALWQSNAWDKQPFSKALKGAGFSGQAEVEFHYDLESLPNDSDTDTGCVVKIFPVGSWQEKTEYSIYFAGKLDSDKDSGLKSISLYEPSLLGNSQGQLIVEGEYTGEEGAVLLITITTGGRASEVEFSYNFLGGLSGSVEASAKLKDVVVHELPNGLSVRLITAEDELIIEDDFLSIYVEKPYYLEDTYKYSFVTASEEIISVDATYSTSPLGLLEGQIGVTGYKSPLSIESISPRDESSNVPLTTRKIVIQLSEDVNPDTVTTETFKLTASPSDGMGELYSPKYSIVVEGNKVYLTIEEG